MGKNRKAFAVLILVVAGIQLIRPARTNPVVDQSRGYKAHLNVTPEVARVLDRSCSDCHSHNTVWPWYSNVAPVSWVVSDDVKQGRRKLNLSEWDNHSGETGKLLDKICEEVKTHGMPLRSYAWVHRDKRLTDQERAAICNWTVAERQRLASQLPSPNAGAR